jgi:MFS family permease
MRRTLMTAAVFALLAMIYVPTPHRGYRLIFSSDDTSIAFFQLLVNVVFAALLGAILATIVPKLPRWAWRWITAIALIALCIMAAVAWRNFMEAAVSQARSDEEFADEQLAQHYSDAAKFTLRNAART